MAETGKQDIIIVRRQEPEEDAPKGGVWKIAHADFMTAMMAFFLVMWLISVADKETRTSVANYFNPVQLAESTPDRKGLHDPQNNAPETENDAKKSPPPSGPGDDKGGASPQAQKPRHKEGALFQDPYAVLAKLAAEADQEHPDDTSVADASFGDNLQPGTHGGEAYRDPFDPLYWQVTPVAPAKSKLRVLQKPLRLSRRRGPSMLARPHLKALLIMSRRSRLALTQARQPSRPSPQRSQPRAIRINRRISS